MIIILHCFHACLFYSLFSSHLLNPCKLSTKTKNALVTRVHHIMQNGHVLLLWGVSSPLPTSKWMPNLATAAASLTYCFYLFSRETNKQDTFQLWHSSSSVLHNSHPCCFKIFPDACVGFISLQVSLHVSHHDSQHKLPPLVHVVSGHLCIPSCFLPTVLQ